MSPSFFQVLTQSARESMQPFLQGMNLRNRRMLVLFPDDAGGIRAIMLTSVQRSSRVENKLVFRIPWFTRDHVECGSVAFDIVTGEMFTGSGAPCFFIVADTDDWSMERTLRIYTDRYPGAPISVY